MSYKRFLVELLMAESDGRARRRSGRRRKAAQFPRQKSAVWVTRVVLPALPAVVGVSDGMPGQGVVAAAGVEYGEFVGMGRWVVLFQPS